MGCTDATGALVVTGGGSAALPTAPVGQVLVSAGAGTTPVFSDDVVLSSTSPSVVLIDSAQPADQRRWRLQTVPGGYLVIDIENDAGAQVQRPLYITRNGGGLVLETSLQAHTLRATNHVDLVEIAFAAVVNQQVGSLANFSDSTVNTVGSTIVGGGSNHVLGRYNGTVWKVVA
jgi:hypothetical protein